MVFITATSDLDTPGALQMFLSLMQKAKEPELLLFAGDGLTSLAFAAIVWRRVPETRPAGAPAEHPRAALAGVLRPIADRVYVLDNGRIVFRGTPQELDAREDIKKHHLGV